MAAAACAPDAIARAAASRSPLAPRRPRGDDGSGRAGTARTSGVGGAPSAGVPVILNKFYIEELTFHQIVVKLTMQMDEQCDDKALQPFHPMNSLGAFAHVVSAPLSLSLSLDQMLIRDVFEPGDAILDRIYQRYEMSIKYQLLKLIGSKLMPLDLLVKPLEIFADLRGGVRQFFIEQRKGMIIQSPKVFAASLGSAGASAAGGMGQFAFRFTSGVTKELAYDLRGSHETASTCTAAARRATRAQHAAGIQLAGSPSERGSTRASRAWCASQLGREAPRCEASSRDGQGRHRYHCQADPGHRRRHLQTAEGGVRGQAADWRQGGGHAGYASRGSCPSAPRRAPWMVAAPPCAALP